MEDATNTPAAAILLVDDHEGIRDIIGEALERAGYRVLTAANVPDAYALWNTRRNDVTLVVTDFHLGPQTGQELVDLIQVHDPDLPFLVMSGLLTSEEILSLRGVVLPALEKPLLIPEFLTAVRQALAMVREEG